MMVIGRYLHYSLFVCVVPRCIPQFWVYPIFCNLFSACTNANIVNLAKQESEKAWKWKKLWWCSFLLPMKHSLFLMGRCAKRKKFFQERLTKKLHFYACWFKFHFRLPLQVLWLTYPICGAQSPLSSSSELSRSVAVRWTSWTHHQPSSSRGTVASAPVAVFSWEHLVPFPTSFNKHASSNRIVLWHSPTRKRACVDWSPFSACVNTHQM